MGGSQVHDAIAPRDARQPISFELSKQGYFTIMLAVAQELLGAALEEDGFKVVVTPHGLGDDVLKRQAKGWAILTRNSKDFVDDAVRYDYDVIGIEDIKFIDDKRDRTNQTVQKIFDCSTPKPDRSVAGQFPVKDS